MNKIKECIIKYKWFLVLIIIIPLVINLITAGNIKSPGSWTSVYAEYIGVVISSLLALFILFKQLEENHKENNNNRKLQTDILKYQQDKEWLNDLRKASVDLLKAMNLNENINVKDSIIAYYRDEPYSIKDNKILIKDVKELQNKITIASYNFNILIGLIGDFDDKEKQLLDILNTIVNEYMSLSVDFYWLVLSIPKKSTGNRSRDLAGAKYVVDQLRESFGNDKSMSKRLDYYIEKYGFDFYEHSTEIIIDRYEDFTNNVRCEECNTPLISELIKYENYKIKGKYKSYNC